MATKRDEIIRAIVIAIILILIAFMIRALIPLHLTRAELIASTNYPNWVKYLLY